MRFKGRPFSKSKKNKFTKYIKFRIYVKKIDDEVLDMLIFYGSLLHCGVLDGVLLRVHIHIDK